ncbi:MAG: hypothetical protein WCP69_08195 [Bacteroidota bacterium]
MASSFKFFKKNILLLVVILGAQIFITNAQQKLICKDTEKPLKEGTVVRSKIIGSIDSVIYVSTTRWVLPNDLRISMYNKDSCSLIKTIGVKNYGDKPNNPNLFFAKFNQAIIKNNKIYVSWIVENKMESKLILQILDKDLNVIQPPIVMYKFINVRNSTSLAHPFFMMSPNGNKMIVGGEETSEKGKNIKMQYKIINCDNMEVENTIQSELPYSVSFNSGFTSSKYLMDNQGILFYNTSIYYKDGSLTKTGQLIGNIRPENSELNYKLLSYNQLQITNFNIEIVEDELFTYGIYNAKFDSKKYLNGELEIEQGLFTLKLDKKTLSIKEDIKFELLNNEKFAYSDLEMSTKQKKKLSMGEFAIAHLNSRNLMVSQCYKTSDNGLLLALNNQYYLSDCGTRECSGQTKLNEIYFVKLNEQKEIRWISCTNQNTTIPEYLDFHNTMIQKEDDFYFIQAHEKENIVYKINEKTGLISESKHPKKYSRETIEVIDNQQYFIALTDSRLSMFAKTAIGICVTGAIASAFVFPYLIPVFVITGPVFTGLKASNVYMGKFCIQL